VSAGEEREFFIDNLLVRIHFIIGMIRWTGLASWEFEFPLQENIAMTLERMAKSHVVDSSTPPPLSRERVLY